MPRYNLIISEDTYLRLMKFAAKNDMSIGKAINTILKKFLETWERSEESGSDGE